MEATLHHHTSGVVTAATFRTRHGEVISITEDSQGRLVVNASGHRLVVEPVAANEVRLVPRLSG